MYHVVVVGSKPNFTKPAGIQFDIGYFANGAAARAEHFHCIEKIAILSQYLIHEPRTTQVAACYTQVEKSGLRSFIVIGSGKRLNDDDRQFVSPRTISWLTLRALGAFSFFSLLFQGAPGTCVRETAKLLLKGSSTSTKPSTGLAAVLIAMHRIPKPFKRRFKVSVSGVGLSNDGYDYIAGSHQRGHLAVDERLVAALRHRGVKFLDV